MKKITFLALHLGYGGIEKCICDVCNLFADTYEIEILCTYKMYDKVAFDLDPRVKVTYLTSVKPNKKEFIDNIKHLKLISAFKEGLKSLKILKLKKKTMSDKLDNLESDIVVSTRIYFNNILRKKNFDLKIGWEHNHHHGNKKYIKNFINSCKGLDKVVVVSNDLKNTYSNILNKKGINCECLFIPNFINNNVKEPSKLDNNNIISVGRFSKEKGFTDLIDVYKIIEMEKGDTFLNIVGDGKEYKDIKSKIIDYNLTRKIKLHGYKNQEYINELYKNSSLYLMTSYTESFGLVLIEAMSYGVVPLSYSSAEGARDIIDSGFNGYLIDNRNEHEMARLALNLLNDRKLLSKLSKNACITAKKYSASIAKKSWLKLFEGDKK